MFSFDLAFLGLWWWLVLGLVLYSRRSPQSMLGLALFHVVKTELLLLST